MSQSRLPKIQKGIWDTNKILVDKIQAVRSSYCTRAQNLDQNIVRQNRLDSMFLIRKHKLEEISRVNQFIHQRIFSQKSTYSFSKHKPSKRSNKHKKQKSIDHLQQIEQMKRQFEKKSQVSTACQTLCRKQYTLSDKPSNQRLISQISQPSRIQPNYKAEGKRLKQRTKSCKQVPNLNRMNDIIIV